MEQNYKKYTTIETIKNKYKTIFLNVLDEVFCKKFAIIIPEGNTNKSSSEPFFCIEKIKITTEINK